jgi:predicted RNA-binding Zn ribbon-like protein
LSVKTAHERTRGKAYSETFRCPGGALCLDFCNSGQGIRDSRAEEWIASYADLIDWLEAAEAIGAKQAARLRAAGARSPQAGRELWTRSLELREALARVLLARAEGRPAASADLRAIDAEYARTASFARLSATGGGFAWTLDASAEALDAALRPIVESAVQLLTSDKLARLRRCGNSTCYWLFLDETKNCSRRWCEMASCGNLMKVRRHRARSVKALESSREFSRG